MTKLFSKPAPSRSRHRGFLLLEMAIGLCIIALISGSLWLSLGKQSEQNLRRQAEMQMQQIQQALLGFAITYGRLPCPAATSSASALENCQLEHGVLPAATLGINELDPWGRRFTYFASKRFTGTALSNAQASFALDTLGTANITDNQIIASELPLVIVCHGPAGRGAWLTNGTQLPSLYTDESENSDQDLSFFSHLPGPQFDHLLVWINPSILKQQLLQAGRLP